MESFDGPALSCSGGMPENGDENWSCDAAAGAAGGTGMAVVLRPWKTKSRPALPGWSAVGPSAAADRFKMAAPGAEAASVGAAVRGKVADGAVAVASGTSLKRSARNS